MLPWLLCSVLLSVVVIQYFRLKLLESDMNTLTQQLEELLSDDTNVLLHSPTRNAHVCRLVSELNRQLRLLRAERQRFQTGDRELMEAVTNISHDLRTPLTAIRGYLDLMEREDLSPAVQQYLAPISDRTEAMTRLTEELFHYSVIQSAENLSLEPIDLRAAVEEAAAGFYAALKLRGIRPDISLPDQPVVRQLDRASIGRVLGNILSNALKYSTGDLIVSLSEEGELHFTNTAPGLDKVSVGRLFDRFFTVETAHGSTGLGLAIARALVEQMGGTIGAEYSDDQLLTVWVMFSA